MKVISIFFTVFVTLVSAHFDQFLGKYASVQILTTCLGEGYMSEWYQKFSEAKDFCAQQSSESVLDAVPLEDLRRPLNEGNQPLNVPGSPTDPASPLLTLLDYNADQQNPLNGFLNVAQILNALQGGQSQPILMVPLPYAQNGQDGESALTSLFRRQKRSVPSPMFDEEKIMGLYDAIQNRAGNFTCVVKRLDIFDENFEVNVLTWMNKLSELNLDEDLLADMVSSYEDCTKFAACKPLNRMSLEPPAVQRAKAFVTCQTKQELAACVKADLIQKQAKFDQVALGKIRTTEDMDDGDKMYSLLWGEFSKGHGY